MIDSFINHYSEQGHIFGECFCDPTSSLIYVNIPKNASMWTRNILKDNGWYSTNYHINQLYDQTAIVVLRDPVPRWISGIAEYFWNLNPKIEIKDFTPVLLDVIFDRVGVDSHTERQTYYIDGLNVDKSIYFWQDNTYRYNLNHFLETRGIATQAAITPEHHVGKNIPKKKEIIDFFTLLLDSNPKYLSRVNGYFSADHKLLDTVKFYTQ